MGFSRRRLLYRAGSLFPRHPYLFPIADWGYTDRRWMVHANGDGRADFCRAVGDPSGPNSFLPCWSPRRPSSRASRRSSSSARTSRRCAGCPTGARPRSGRPKHEPRRGARRFARLAPATALTHVPAGPTLRAFGMVAADRFRRALKSVGGLVPAQPACTGSRAVDSTQLKRMLLGHFE